jgi:hypothetical protein
LKKYILLYLTIVWLTNQADANNVQTIGLTTDSMPVKKFFSEDRIKYDGSCLTVEGEDIFVYSAAFHYFRCPQELWRKRFQKIKEAGFNTVETYVPWNWHEKDMPKNVNDNSKFDFRDLKAWLKMAHDEFGFYTIVRPGPFICAEWAGGGHPRWLSKYCPIKYETSFWLRSDHPEYIKWSQHWYKAACQVFEPEQIINKPKGKKGILMVQLENEYYYFDMPSENKVRYLKALYQTTRNSGIKVPLFTCVTPEVRGSKDLEISQLFDMDNQYVWWNIQEAKTRIEKLKMEQTNAPAFVCELQGGWFSTIGGKLSEDDSYLDGRHARGMALMAMAGGATGLNFYMYFGGTHFDGWGARRMTTTYDYGAPLKENGGVGEKYQATKEIGAFIQKFGKKLTRSLSVSCELKNNHPDLTIGCRKAPDGTLFVFIFNKNKKDAINGTFELIPDQGNSINLTYQIGALDTKVCVFEANGDAKMSTSWYPQPMESVVRPTDLPSAIRIVEAKKRNENFIASWIPLHPSTSLPEMGVNDARYAMYKSNFTLSANELSKYGSLVFKMFTKDPVFVQINGKIAKRNSVDQSDNVFDTGDLLKKGSNEIIAIYENQGHAHGYKPMEELSGVTQGGLCKLKQVIDPLEQWEVKKAKSDQEKDVLNALEESDGWEKIMLDGETIDALATLQIAGLEKPKWPAAWYLQGKVGTVIYRIGLHFNKDMIATGQTVLEFGSIDDRGVIYVNGKRVGEHLEWDAPCIINVAEHLKPGLNIIAVAVTNQYGTGGLLKAIRLRRQLTIDKQLNWSLAKDMGGVQQKWFSNTISTKNWTRVTLDSTKTIQRKGNNIQPKGMYDALFTWYRVEFDLPNESDGSFIPWRALVHASGNGYIWLNGHNIGRHWEIGPQREFYLPECWLNYGKNKKNVLVFGLRQTAQNGGLLHAVEIAPYTDCAEVMK